MTTPKLRRTRSRRLSVAERERVRAWIATVPGSVKTAAPRLRVGLSTLHRALAGEPVDGTTAERIVSHLVSLSPG